MEKQNLITKAIEIIGIKEFAKACSMTRQGILRWQDNGRVPRSDFTRETHYASIIEFESKGQITEAELLDWRNISPTLS
jgi:hypothetical protein